MEINNAKHILVTPLSIVKQPYYTYI